MTAAAKWQRSTLNMNWKQAHILANNPGRTSINLGAPRPKPGGPTTFYPLFALKYAPFYLHRFIRRHQQPKLLHIRRYFRVALCPASAILNIIVIKWRKCSSKPTPKNSGQCNWWRTNNNNNNNNKSTQTIQFSCFIKSNFFADIFFIKSNKINEK